MTAWPEADRLFRTQPGCLGMDDAYSVPLGGDRTLWLFGDTFLGDAGRATAGFVSNTVAVQTGLDPATATLDRWPPDASYGPVFASGQDGEWLWPLHGARLGGGLLLFFMRVRGTRPGLAHAEAWAEEGSLGFFEVVGAAARWVPDADAPPREWHPEPVPLPPCDGVLGTAVLVDGGHLYAYAYRDAPRDALLARWPLDRAPDLSDPEWWDGAGWGGAPVPVLDGVVTEFTVHRQDARTLVQTQVSDPMHPTVDVRTAPAPEGPWPAPKPVYAPPEGARDAVIAYAGKAHPELRAGDEDERLVVTYASIALTRAATLADPDVYWPRFARVSLP